MKIITESVIYAMLSLCVVGLGTAQAADGWYIGGSAGSSNYDISEDDFVPSLGVVGSTKVDDEDVIWKMFGGYRINDNLALEFAYADFGSFDVISTITAPFAAETHSEFKPTALLLDAVGILPLSDRFEIFGKVGLAVWEIEVDISGTPGVVRLAPDFDDDGSDFHYGVGVAAHLTDSVAVRAEWEAINLDEDVDGLSIGVQFNF